MNKKTGLCIKYFSWTFILIMTCFICLSFGFSSKPSFAQEDAQKTTAAIPEMASSADSAPAETPEAVESKEAAPEAVSEEPPVDAQKSAVEKPAAAQEEEAAVVEPGNVTVNFKGADIRTVLAYISEVSGVDIVPAPDVKGVVDLKLTNKPWKSALDIILRNYGFAYEREGDIIRVVTIDKLKQEELATQSFNLNYSKSKDVVAAIKDIVSDRGKVMYDERTNTVLVTDIPTNIYKIGQIIGRLDRKTPQVLIEVRAIETVLEDSEKMGIDWNIKFTASGAKRPTTLPFDAWKTPFNDKKNEGNPYFPQTLAASPQTTVAGAGGTTSTTESAEFPGSGDGVYGFPYAQPDQFSFGTLDFSEFKAVLEMIKARANTEIVSNPRIATLNNMEATINVGQTLNLPKYERNSSTGKMEIIGYDAKTLGILLKVTPHVNDNNEIVVDLAPEISDLLRYDTLDAASGVVAPVFSARLAKTQVRINDGDTIFIGGMIKDNDVDVTTKMPIVGDMLGDVPYLGLLFSKKSKQKQKTELIFFITVNMLTADKVLESSPTANDVTIPMFTSVQDKADAAAKKNKKNKKR